MFIPKIMLLINLVLKIQTVKPLDPKILPLSIALRFISIALSLAVELALVKLPYLKLSETSSES